MTAEKGKRAAYALGYKLETVWTSPASVDIR